MTLKLCEVSVNKHIETLVGFKAGTKKQAKEAFYTLWDVWDDLVSAFKKIGWVLWVFVWWLISLLLICCCLPLATYLRLKFEKQNQIALEKVREAYCRKMLPVSEDDSND